MVERGKLRPVNLSKHDATKAIFKERQSVGASMADIQPMEMVRFRLKSSFSILLTSMYFHPDFIQISSYDQDFFRNSHYQSLIQINNNAN